MNGKGNTYNSFWNFVISWFMIIYTKIPQWYALHLYKKWYRAKKFDVLKPQTCVPRNFLGIFRGNSEEQYKLIEIPKKYDFLGISSVYSEEIWFPRYFIGIFRGNMISSIFHRYIPRKFVGIFRGSHFPSECPSELRCFLVVFSGKLLINKIKLMDVRV